MGTVCLIPLKHWISHLKYFITITLNVESVLYILYLFSEYLLKRANTAAMEHIYEEILSPCKRLKVSSNVLPDGLHHPNPPLKGYHAPPPSVMSSDDKKTRPLKVLQNEGQYVSTILLYKEKTLSFRTVV